MTYEGGGNPVAFRRSWDTFVDMDESAAVERVSMALAHLRDFRASWNEGDLIDESSRLTADDIGVIIEVMDSITSIARRGVEMKP
ncbi:hypothetical protein [Sphingomonas sp.]|uniref:hypothetical protein n=1 Tax=Sphingomonas sp. TaxID=28214 RepID=UPI0035AD8629